MIRRFIGRILEWFLSYGHIIDYQSVDTFGVQPRKSYMGDAGYDLYISRDVTIPAGGHTDVPSHIRFRLPPRVWLMIQPRSSAMKKLGLVVITAVIDNGYRGDMFVQVLNPTDKNVELITGDRVGQVIPFRIVPLNFRCRIVDGDTDRGHKGFGSSGGI
jgi:dUTP pyrophosphatase